MARGARGQYRRGSDMPTSITLSPFLVLSLYLLAATRGLTPAEVIEVMVRGVGLEPELRGLGVVVAEIPGVVAGKVHRHASGGSAHSHEWGHRDRWKWELVIGEVVIEYGYRNGEEAAVQAGERAMSEIIEGIGEIVK